MFSDDLNLLHGVSSFLEKADLSSLALINKELYALSTEGRLIDDDSRFWQTAVERAFGPHAQQYRTQFNSFKDLFCNLVPLSIDSVTRIQDDYFATAVRNQDQRQTIWQNLMEREFLDLANYFFPHVDTLSKCYRAIYSQALLDCANIEDIDIDDCLNRAELSYDNSPDSDFPYYVQVFKNAISSGKTNVVQWYLHKDLETEMIILHRYISIDDVNNAAAGGHGEIVKMLYYHYFNCEETDPRLHGYIPDMPYCLDETSATSAGKYGHLEIVQWIWEITEPHVYPDISQLVLHGSAKSIPVLDWLIALPEYPLSMRDLCNLDLTAVALTADLAMVQWIWHITKGELRPEISEITSSISCGQVITTVYSNYGTINLKQQPITITDGQLRDLLRWLHGISKIPIADDQFKTISAWAGEREFMHVVQWIWEVTTPHVYPPIKQMITFRKFTVMKWMVETNHCFGKHILESALGSRDFAMFDFLQTCAMDWVNISPDQSHIIRAVEQGDLQMLEILRIFPECACPKYYSSIIEWAQSWDILTAILHGHLPVVLWMINQFSAELRWWIETWATTFSKDQPTMKVKAWIVANVDTISLSQVLAKMMTIFQYTDRLLSCSKSEIFQWLYDNGFTVEVHMANRMLMTGNMSVLAWMASINIGPDQNTIRAVRRMYENPSKRKYKSVYDFLVVNGHLP